MSDEPRTPELHPEAELASYVDGSATEDERRLVETHVAECSSCRADLEFAARGHVALDALPQVEAPGLAEHALGWLSPQDGEVALERGVTIRDPRRRSSRRAPTWHRVAWGAGLAAAAAVAAVFLFTTLQGGTTNTAGGSGPAFGPVTGGIPNNQVQGVRSGTNYDAASINALARRLVRTGGVAVASGTTGTAPVPAAASTFSASRTTEALDQAATDQAVGCLQRGAGLSTNAKASFVEVASFDGKPAFIGAFPNSPSGGGTATQLVVAAVDQLNCRILYLVTLSL